MTNKFNTDVEVHLGDQSQVNGSGILQTSEDTVIIECKMVDDLQLNWHNDLTVNGGTITYLAPESAASLNVTTASGSRAVRESVRYAPYVPGNPTKGSLTGVLGPQNNNNLSRIGLHNDLDGPFFERNSTDIRLVIRSSTSGSSVDTNYYALGGVVLPGWEIFDILDGSNNPSLNPSGLTIDWTKSQLFYIDYLWQGVGTVRFFVRLNGEYQLIARFTGANVFSQAYMATGTLPVRYEILNTGVTDSASSMKQVCWTVRTSGKFAIPGVDYSTGRGISTKAVTVRKPILAIRMAPTIGPAAKINRRLAQFVLANYLCTTNSAYIEIVHYHTDYTNTFKSDGITPATWNAIAPDSGVQVSIDIDIIPDGTGHVVANDFLASGVGTGFTTGEKTLDPAGQHSWISNNMDGSKSQMFVLYATAFTGTSNVTASFEFHEVS